MGIRFHPELLVFSILCMGIGSVHASSDASEDLGAAACINLEEIEIYGPEDPSRNLALEASLTYDTGYEDPGAIQSIIDGHVSTSWYGILRVPESWIEVDLGADRTIDRVVLRLRIPRSRSPRPIEAYAWRMTIAPAKDRETHTVVAQADSSAGPVVDSSADGTWLNVDQEGHPVPAVGRYVRLEILSCTKMFYDVLLSPDRMYSIEDFHYEDGPLRLDVEQGILVPGITQAGVTAVTIVGTGTYGVTPPCPDSLSSEFQTVIKAFIAAAMGWIDAPISGAFTYLYLRFHPQRYVEIFPDSLLQPVRDLWHFAEAKEVHNTHFPKSFHMGKLASLPSPRALGVRIIPAQGDSLIYIAYDGGETVPFFGIKEPKPVVAPAPSEMDVLHYDINARIEPELHTLSGKAQIALKVLGEGEGWVRFDLRRNFQVHGITDARGDSLEYQLGLEDLYVHIGSVPTESDTVCIDVEYSGNVVTDSTLGRIWDYIGGEGTYVRPGAVWYPRHRGDRAAARMAFTVPDTLTVVSNGRLEGVSEEEGRRTFQWVVDDPAMGLAFAAARYIRDERVESGVALECYLFPQHTEKAEEYLDRCGEILSFYSVKFGPYPFDKFAVVEIPQGYGGGHGDQSFIMMYERAFRGGFDEKFWAHEIAHQWWGNWVGVKPEYGDWLAEGLAEYSSLLFIEYKYGQEAFRKKLKDLSSAYLGSERAGLDEPLLRNASDPVVAYKKGAYFFHMLRYIAGEERFFAMLRTLVETYGGKEIDPSALQQVCEAILEEDLSWFFDQWLDQQGEPEYRLTWECTKRPAGGYTLNGIIHQVPGTFRMPLEVVAGDDHEPLVWRVWVEGEETPFSFEVERKVKEVLLDPAHWVLRHTPQTRAYAQMMEYMREGEVLWKKKDYQEAKVAFEQALALQPEGELRGRILHILGRTEYKLEESDAAFAHLQEALPLLGQGHWTTAWARNTLGDIYIDKGEYEKARLEYEAVVAMEATPNSVKYAKEQLAKLSGESDEE